MSCSWPRPPFRVVEKFEREREKVGIGRCRDLRHWLWLSGRPWSQSQQHESKSLNLGPGPVVVLRLAQRTPWLAIPPSFCIGNYSVFLAFICMQN